MKIDNNQSRFEKIIVDADRNLIMSAKYVQEDYIIVHNKLTGYEKEFANISTFWGLGKEIKGELREWMNLIGSDVPKEDFEISYHSRLRDDLDNHLEEAKIQFSYFVSQLKNLPYSDQYVLCIGGEGNFRYDIATILPYKGQRKEKPILFEQLKQEIISQYKNKIHLANGIEADDLLGIYAAESQKHFRKTGQYKYLLAYVDKDLNQLWGPHIKLGEFDKGISYITPLEAAMSFGTQCLMGDATDFIKGLEGLTEEIRDKYDLRKGKGCGEASARNIIKGCATPKEVMERVVECYKAWYEEDWKSPFEENARLLWMLRTPDIDWNVFTDLLDKLGVNYG